MSSSNSASKVPKINSTAEPKLKQARLTFPSTAKKSDTTKKRKREEDVEIKNKSATIYLDLTNSNDGVNNHEESEDVKSNKVCIIDGDSKYEKTSPGKVEDNCMKRNLLQEWVKPKKSRVAKSKSHEPESACIIRIKSKGDELMEVESENENDIEKEDLDISQNSHKLDGSVISILDDDALNTSHDISLTEIKKDSVPSTPKNESNSSESVVKKKLTPKQIQRREEFEMRRKEKERLKQEKDEKRQKEKEEKQKLKEEKEKKRLAEIEAKNEEKRQKEEERKAKEEEKKRLKEEERKQKEEEKKQKEEEKKLKEEERRQKEEQKRQKEEQERKKKEKTVAAFTNFFLPKNKEGVENVFKRSDTVFMPFEVKENMRLAVVHRVNLPKEKLNYLNDILQNTRELDKSSLYLAQLKSKEYKPGSSENTWPLNNVDDDDDVIIVGDEPNADTLSVTEKPMKYHCKLLQFHENKRPAYWGTWRKKSKTINGRKPFKHDEIFDYEVDSDEEWEDEPGESLDGSDDEKESEDDYEVDNDVFVPHGYLSDEEAQNDDLLDSSPKSHKLKLNILEKQFEEEMKEKTHKLKPRIFGCIWIDNSIKKNEANNHIENLLLTFRAVYKEDKVPFAIQFQTDNVTSQSTPSLKVKLKNEFPDTCLPDLVRLVHGNKRNTKLLAKEFNAYILIKDSSMNLTMSCIIKKIKEISNWIANLSCRVVNDEIKSQCDLTDLSYKGNTWKYIKISEDQTNDKNPKEDGLATVIPVSNTSNPLNSSSITKFVKVLTAEEKLKTSNEAENEKGTEKLEKPEKLVNTKKKGDITKFVKVLNLVEKKSKELEPSSEIINLVQNDSISNCDRNDESEIESSLENPKKINDSKTKPINVLIPKKKPRTPISKSSDKINVTLAQEDNSPKSISAKPVNILIPKKQPSVPKFDSKHVNVLIPKRVSSNQEKNPQKPVNILIPRRAKDVRKDHLNDKNSKISDEIEKKSNIKDFTEDCSVDFTLKIDSDESPIENDVEMK